MSIIDTIWNTPASEIEINFFFAGLKIFLMLSLFALLLLLFVFLYLYLNNKDFVIVGGVFGCLAVFLLRSQIMQFWENAKDFASFWGVGMPEMSFSLSGLSLSGLPAFSLSSSGLSGLLSFRSSADSDTIGTVMANNPLQCVMLAVVVVVLLFATFQFANKISSKGVRQ